MSELTKFLDRHSDHASRAEKSAAFDCDGTVIRGDIGECMFYRQIEQFHFRISPAEIWTDHPHRGELDRLFRSVDALPPGQRSQKRDFVQFADILLSWYFGQIDDGRVEKACSDIVRLWAGYTEREVRQIAAESFAAELASPLSGRMLGGRRIPRGVRFLRETVALIHALQDRGFAIWAISGSNRWSVEPVFRALGVPPERVLGISLAREGEILLPKTEEPVPIRQKKVDALRQHTSVPPLLAASDSRNDIPLLLYAAEVRVFVNSRRRNASDFFTSTGIPQDETWTVIDAPTVLEGEPGRG